MDKKEVEIALVPKRKLSEIEKEYIDLKIEKLRLDREKSILILNKGLSLFFAVMALGIIGMINQYFSKMFVNLLIVISIVILIISILPYSSSTKKEEIELQKLFDSLLK